MQLRVRIVAIIKEVDMHQLVGKTRPYSILFETELNFWPKKVADLLKANQLISPNMKDWCLI